MATDALNLSQAMTWALAQRTPTGSAKAVLMALAWGLCDGRRPVSHARIASWAGLSVRTVGEALTELEELGLIRQVHRAMRRSIIGLAAFWGDAEAPLTPTTRFLGVVDSPTHILFDWMLEQDPAGVSFRDIQKRGPLRAAGAADAALSELVDLGHAEEVCQRPRRVRLTTHSLADAALAETELPF